MAAQLKDFFDTALVQRLGASLRAVHPTFDERAFRRRATDGLDALELLDRGRHLMRAMHAGLPARYEDAIDVIERSLGPVGNIDAVSGMAPFFYLPHTMFVAEHGLAHPARSLDAMHAITQRFSCEFAIRPFLEQHRELTLARLDGWVTDPSPHVRRLVSEGMRPRLPWAARVRWLIEDPEPGLARIARLVDDESETVRRSVANHLNDVAKDHPARAVEIARAWVRVPAREKTVRHALRTLIKRGDAGALEVLGVSSARPECEVRGAITPARVKRGGEVRIDATITTAAPLDAVIDLVVHYVKARGQTSAKVFKWTRASLAPGAALALTRRLSLEERTTRKHHPGEHRVEVQINGTRFPLGAFVLR
ncbi:hypothetical protein [Sandaracinus amylolyticus]|uniref:DNA alkylation repair enzyme n=1 Tax=Sandaracinus amylolyticus TaxID=927083 RepID=A0A0F6YNM9_9BACT|nr:hypothetical protein [Sandaracinus amylolyticus]AKF11697.1 DNA alkylation repair enzyme [Sandaracinus amylolyticus]